MLGKCVSPDGGSKILIIEVDPSGTRVGIGAETAWFEARGKLLYGTETRSHNGSEN